MFVTRSLEGVSFHPSPRGQFSRVVDRTHAAIRYSQLRASGSRSSPAAPLLLRDAEITTGAAFTTPTKIPANRTAGSVKCRPSSARRRERPVVLHSTTGPRALRVGVREIGAICGSPSPGADISHGATHSP